MGFFDLFWNRYPALLYGLCALIGFSAAFHQSWILLVPIAVLMVPQVISAWNGIERALPRLILSFALFVVTFFYGMHHYKFPPPSQDGFKGIAHISVSSLQTRATHFGTQWAYQGAISHFVPDSATDNESIATNIPYSLSLPRNDLIIRPPANQDYVIHATLKQTNNGQYILKVSPHEPWQPIKGSWSLAEYRYSAKQSVKSYIANNIKNSYSASFLSGLATGEFENRIFSFEFGRFGLQHIMAISGFHFTIIAAILSLFLRFIFTKKRGSLLVIFFLSSYFVFLGCGPSIMRAWIAISIGLGSHLIEKRAYALNSLGIALLVILFIDPLSCVGIGFQFSFLTTAAILILFSGCDFLLEKVLTKRPLSQMIEMNSLNQHGYYILSIFRQGLSLSLAVNLVAMPVMLFYFQKFPWMSLLYNLFFPLLVSISMFLLIVGTFLSLTFPLAAGWIHSFNSGFTQWILNFTFNMPTTLDVYLRVDPIPSWILICYLCVIFVIGIFIKGYMEKEKEQMQDLAYM